MSSSLALALALATLWASPVNRDLRILSGSREERRQVHGIRTYGPALTALDSILWRGVAAAKKRPSSPWDPFLRLHWPCFLDTVYAHVRPTTAANARVAPAGGIALLEPRLRRLDCRSHTITHPFFSVFLLDTKIPRPLRFREIGIEETAPPPPLRNGPNMDATVKTWTQEDAANGLSTRLAVQPRYETPSKQPCHWLEAIDGAMSTSITPFALTPVPKRRVRNHADHDPALSALPALWPEDAWEHDAKGSSAAKAANHPFSRERLILRRRSSTDAERANPSRSGIEGRRACCF
ncbi:hypothetical protein CSOJ01_02886 [Colletotrichum sojae]|uniref:Uncharacterized protein n=1 Tax=Colletotrichum sojae TaxID=2175907 RepID=A0A8H6JNI4_9PEZI|nr:hypothetical protein CSOJ01_02886 [Colletotrichum sojae]